MPIGARQAKSLIVPFRHAKNLVQVPGFIILLYLHTDLFHEPVEKL